MCLYSHSRSLFKAAFKYNLFIQKCNLAFSKQCVDIQVFVQNQQVSIRTDCNAAFNAGFAEQLGRCRGQQLDSLFQRQAAAYQTLDRQMQIFRRAVGETNAVTISLNLGWEPKASLLIVR